MSLEATQHTGRSEPVNGRKLERQINVSRMLSYGFVFSIMPVGGLGSLAALILGIISIRVIRQSNGEIVGNKMAWWCIVIGTLGALTLPLVIIKTVIANLK